MPSMNLSYTYTLLTYFADIDIIQHGFKHALHDKQGYFQLQYTPGHDKVENLGSTLHFLPKEKYIAYAHYGKGVARVNLFNT